MVLRCKARSASALARLLVATPAVELLLQPRMAHAAGNTVDPCSYGIAAPATVTGLPVTTTAGTATYTAPPPPDGTSPATDGWRRKRRAMAGR